ncbi:MAG TPA: hypothetical protein VF044_06875 [Actinomycetota bacterium]
MPSPGDRGRAAAVPDDDGPAPPGAAGHPPSRAGAVGSAVAVVAALATIAVLAVRPAPDVPSASPSPGPSPRLTGTLVFARLGTSDLLQLWRWDLATGRVGPGPVVRRPVELVNASAARPGWVGLTWRLSDGRLRAGVLRSLDVAASPATLITGDLVSWGARGGRVSAARRGPRSGCERDVRVLGTQLRPRLREQAFRVRVCGDVLSLGRAGAVTYATVLDRGRLAIGYVAGEGFRRVLDGHVLASVSWASDMLVRPAKVADAGAPAASGGGGPARSSVVVDDRLGYAQATSDVVGGYGASPYRLGGEPFRTARVLAWAPNSFEALAIGRADDGVRGIYVLDTLPSDGLSSPRRVATADGPTWATYTGDGVAIVFTGGDVLAIDGAAVVPVEVPLGSPLPDGPVTWIPGTTPQAERASG